MARRPALTLGDIQRAAEVVSTVAHETPLLTSRTLSELTGAQLLLKAENLQRTGSFKIRGASFKLSTLSASQRTAGVVAASAGNHAQGVALAAADAGIPCRVVMPVQASMTKVAATRASRMEPRSFSTGRPSTKPSAARETSRRTRGSRSSPPSTT